MSENGNSKRRDEEMSYGEREEEGNEGRKEGREGGSGELERRREGNVDLNVLRLQGFNGAKR